MLERETERLILRPFRREDADFLLRLVNDPDFLAQVEDKGLRTRCQASIYIERTLGVGGRDPGLGQGLVARRDTGQPIGMCGLVRRDPGPEVDLGYALLPEARGRGYALEAARAVLDGARDGLGLDAVFALVAPGNVRSIAILARLGFAFAQALPRSPGPGWIHLYALDLRPSRTGGPSTR